LAERGWFVSSSLLMSPIFSLESAFAANRGDVLSLLWGHQPLEHSEARRQMAD
jgi:hypothetical protein